MSQFFASVQEGFWRYFAPCLSGMAVGLLVLLAVFVFFLRYWSVCRPRRGSLEWIAMEEARRPLTFSLPLHPMEKKDALPLLLITAVYAATAFFRLGAFTAPQSALDFGANQTVTISFGQPVTIAKLRYFSNLGTGDYNVEISSDGETWSTLWARHEDEEDPDKITGYYWADAQDYSPSYALPQEYNDLFKWLDIEVDNPLSARYMRITGRSDKGLLELGELALYGSAGESQDLQARLTLSAGPASSGISVTGADALFDEQETVPDLPSWYNSAYFDEIYHPRTALEHIENVYPYEVSHPPLGKLIISLGIRIFGMAPFGWRFMGALFGVGMLPILYVFLKNLFGRTVVAACATALFAFDFMHLTQTRIATIDTYGVFFILLMYFFMYRYLTLPAGTSFRRGALPLFLSGLFWGIGAASKWTVIYGGAGLCLLYFIGLFFKHREWPAGESAPRFAPWLIKTLLFSVLAFVLLPGLIYVLSYWPYASARGNEAGLGGILLEIVSWPFVQLPQVLRGERELFLSNSQNIVDIMLQNQHFMLTYHEGVHASHPYSSRWYQWIVDARPILYYLDNTSGKAEGLKAAFGCFNNPIVCWGGLLAVLTCAAQTFHRRWAKRLFFLLLALAGLGACVGVDGLLSSELDAPVLIGHLTVMVLALLLYAGLCSLAVWGSARTDGRTLFLLVGYLSQLLPWLLIGRTTFEYHYFPSTLFLTLALGLVLDECIQRRPGKWKTPVYAFTGGAIALYAAFYPVLIGLMVPVWYTSGLLKWLPSWPF